VTHGHETKLVNGWAGAGVPDAFVSNRTVGDTPHGRIVDHIRDMVFSARA